MRNLRALPNLILVALVAVVAGACGVLRTAQPVELPAHRDESIVQLLDHVQVIEDRPNPPGYDRDCGPEHGCVFGTAWKDVDRNGCDTRSDVLGKQLTEVVFKPGTRQCKVKSGHLRDPYTGSNLRYPQDPVEIDHLFPLALAWDMGANTWTVERRTAFANDPNNLRATSRTNNRAKSDKGPAEWTGHVAANERCAYVKDFLTVAAAYQLPIPRADAESIRATANNCV